MKDIFFAATSSRDLGLLLGRSAAAFAVLCSSACGDAVENLGLTNEPQPAASVEANGASYASANVADFSGHWIGEAEDALAGVAATGESFPLYHFASGSTQITLDFQYSQQALAGGTPSGALTFGDTTPPAPATDPNAGYPAGMNYQRLAQSGPIKNLPPTEGFAYSVTVRVPDSIELNLDDSEYQLSGGLRDGVLHLQYGTYELFHDWCALQQAKPPSAAGLGCLSWASGITGVGVAANGVPDCKISSTESVDCNQAALCLELEVCACSETGCIDSSPAGPESQLWLRKTPEGGLYGMFVNSLFLNDKQLATSPGIVHFTRVE